MLQIISHGFGCFWMQIKTASGEVSLVTDPYKSEKGANFPKSLSASLIVRSHEGGETQNVSGVQSEQEGVKPFVVDHAGEYEVQGMFVRGVTVGKKGDAIYRLGLGDFSVVFFGAWSGVLTDKQVEALGVVDVMVVPVGGKDGLTVDAARSLTQQVEPRIVVPFMYSGDKGAKEIEAFCKELASPVEEVSKMKIKKSALPQDGMQVYVLS